MEEKDLGEQTIRVYQALCRMREPWKPLLELIYKYGLMKVPVWGDTCSPGTSPTFSIKGVSDDEVIEASRTAATALGGALWPHAGDSFEFIPDLPNNVVSSQDLIYGTDENKKYAQQASKIVGSDFDAPETKWLTSWSEYMDDQPTIGNSGIYGIEQEDDDRRPVRFRSFSITRCVIGEDHKGDVNRLGFELEFTIWQIVEEYGINNVSERIREIYNSGDEAKCNEYIKVIQLIQPRKNGRVGRDVPVEQKKWASVHVEVATKKVLLNSGSDDLTAWMGRFRKLTGELYARSMCADAIPTIKELNVLRHGNTKALDKILDPPMGYYSEAIGGDGKPNISAGAKVPLISGGRIPQGQKPIEQLLQLTEPRVANERLTTLTDRVKVKFMIDRLLDFANRVRMTAHEADLRDGFRNQALNNVFQRQMGDILVPAIKWVFWIRYRRGLVGLHPERDIAIIEQMRANGMQPLVIPDHIAGQLDAGIFPFTIRFISPAARAMKIESLDGADRLLNFAIAAANAGKPQILDNFQEDDSFRLYQDLCGAPSEMVRSKQEVEKNRKARDAALMKQQGAEDMMQQAEILQKGGSGFASVQRGLNG